MSVKETKRKRDVVARPQSVNKDEKKVYKETLTALQIELVKLQRQVIADGDRILIILEGRDTAGKDGAIKRITEHLSARQARVVALAKPSDREQSGWYFQRYVAHLPLAQEMVIFNRSWYNRAGVERVMGFCTKEQYDEFMETVPLLEQMLARSGIRILKYYLDIDKKEQRKRLKRRHEDPLRQWKISPMDEVSASHWDDYSQARNEMFAKTHHVSAPWFVVKADDKRIARIQIIKHLLSQLEYKGKDESLALSDPAVVFPYEDAVLQEHKLSR